MVYYTSGAFTGKYLKYIYKGTKCGSCRDKGNTFTIWGHTQLNKLIK